MGLNLRLAGVPGLAFAGPAGRSRPNHWNGQDHDEINRPGSTRGHRLVSGVNAGCG